MTKEYQNKQQIIKNIKEGQYSWEKVMKGEKNLSWAKKIKKLEKKIQKARKEFTKIRMLLLFELGKKLEEDYKNGGNKYDKHLAWRIYKSFEKTYPWMPYNKD